MRKLAIVAAAMLILTGCETSGEARPKADVNSLAEFAAHQECLGRQAAIYSTAEGSPFELGVIAASGCGTTRHALYSAITKIESRSFAEGYLRTSQREDPKLIASTIVAARQGKLPF